ncbi:MAG: hypothetical protein KGO05_17275 [Chloroflexota bacterium]|nr:hypothetical protein [Chloroflexota bacterium]
MANDNQPNDPAQQPDEAQVEGRDVLDAERKAHTEGRDVIDESGGGEVETIGRTVVDHSHRANPHGVDVIDAGPVTGAPDEGADH